MAHKTKNKKGEGEREEEKIRRELCRSPRESADGNCSERRGRCLLITLAMRAPGERAEKGL